MTENLGPDIEFDRLQELRSYEILGTLPELAFDKITSLASTICETPMAFITLLDKDRQWFKSVIGMNSGAFPRAESLCVRVVEQNELLEIEDLTHDSHYADLPIVKQVPNVRFYAGTPLISPKGLKLGTLSVIDYKPRVLTLAQKTALKTLASLVVDQMELKKANHFVAEAKHKLEDQQELLINKAKLQSVGELAGGICHQINNPLAIIVGRTMILRTILDGKGASNIEMVKKELDIIDSTSIRISNTLKALRMYARDMGNEVHKTNVSDLIGDVLFLMKGKLAEADVIVDFKAEDLASVMVNKNQMTQVFFNLISNAVESMEGLSEKNITIKQSIEEGQLQVMVTDTGAGISSEAKDYIFEPFFSTKSQNFGIGLSNAKSFLEQNRGQLVLIKNSRPTTFLIKLPVCV